MRDAAVAVLEPVVRDGVRVVVGVGVGVVAVVVRMREIVGVRVGVPVVVVVCRRGGRPSRREPAPDLGEQHPAADGEDRERGDDRRGADDQIRWQGGLGRDDDQREPEDPDGVRDGHRRAEAERVAGRAAGPDEVGGHEGLAVAGRQGVARAEEGGGREGEECQGGSYRERAEHVGDRAFAAGDLRLLVASAFAGGLAGRFMPFGQRSPAAPPATPTLG